MSDEGHVKVTIHSKGYVQYFKRYGPMLHPQRVSIAIYESMKRMGYDVRIAEDNRVIAPNTSNDSSSQCNGIKNAEVKQEENTSVDLSGLTETDIDASLEKIDTNANPAEEVIVSEDDEDQPPEQVHEVEPDGSNIDFVKFSRTQYKKMTEKNLYDYLKNIEEIIPKEYLPLEQKPKSELLMIVDAVVLKKV
jgi:hypothetical protein